MCYNICLACVMYAFFIIIRYKFWKENWQYLFRTVWHKWAIWMVFFTRGLMYSYIFVQWETSFVIGSNIYAEFEATFPTYTCYFLLVIFQAKRSSLHVIELYFSISQSLDIDSFHLLLSLSPGGYLHLCSVYILQEESFKATRCL